MSSDIISHFRQTISGMDRGQSWEAVKAENKIKGTEFFPILENFTSQCAAHTKLSQHSMLGFFARHISKMETEVAARATDLDRLVRTGSFLLRGHRRVLLEKKQRELEVIARARGHLDTAVVNLTRLHPSNWDADHLPVGNLVSLTRKPAEINEDQIRRDLTGRGNYFIWRESALGGQWDKLDSNDIAIKAALREFGVTSDEINRSLMVATQDTFNDISHALVASAEPKMLKGVEYRAYFAVEGTSVKVRIEGEAEAVAFGESTGIMADATAYYNGVAPLADREVLIRLSSRG